MTSSQIPPGDLPENVTPLDQQARKAVRFVFATMKIAYPAWYEKHYGDQKAEQLGRRVWLTCLKDLSEEAVERGLHRMVKECKFPPSPSDFLALCKRIDDLPAAGDAWIEALEGRYTHPAVKVAAEATGTFDLRAAKPNDQALRQRFERNYAIVQRRAQNGQALDGKIPAGIEHETKSPMQVQLARSHQEAQDLITAQGIPTDGQSARALLLARMGIRRPA
ncbi:hypothetical protein RRX38_02755 [Pseudomonas sp. DTU_2021_1001937_2_SI_NGA_ILE_001]|uniref:hypothetical protein n=1 Tax=Pseudomonas sp. DTU_2021_1001937_2_SI_NGA_ILE_001 TaxID=3077589 RepID=UPI0028FC1136|nr:hypothetical protein [Pseudomonas sp. DTU_2021_1001937_2_SI_NGA_ILE_001]WNW10110.1 hypothetical protein RRX38_02755 [Pseudomonas sp. DTU_2021_1001937_2_SI_NGA_ILE_001]